MNKIRINLEPQYRQALSIIHPMVALLALYGDKNKLRYRNANNDYRNAATVMACLSGIVSADGYADIDEIGNLPYMVDKLNKLAKICSGAEKTRNYWGFDIQDYHETYDIKPNGNFIIAPDQFWRSCYFITTAILEDIEGSIISDSITEIDDIFTILEFVNECARVWDNANQIPAFCADSKENAAALLGISERLYDVHDTLMNGTIAQAVAVIKAPLASASPLDDIPW